MTSELTAYDRPWLPGAARDTPSLPVALPGGLPPGLRAHVSAPGGGPLPRCSVLTGDGPVRFRVTGEGRAALTLLVPAADAVALWTPGSDRERAVLPPSWEAERQLSPLTGTPTGCLVGRRDQVIAAFAGRAADGRVRMRAGMVEESAELLLSFAADLTRGPLDVHVDFDTPAFTAAVARVGALAGLGAPPADRSAFAPVLCTWYAHHQALDPAVLTAEARDAAALGFGTVIIDDGWQTPDNDRGYGSCGDWSVEPAKLPEPRALVDTLAAAGLRTLWWIGTPFLGHRSTAAARGGLPVLHDEPAMEAAVLDPRSPRVRRHLLDRLTALVRDTGAAGLKVDFLERFAAPGAPPPPPDAVAADPEDAALSLLDALTRELATVVAAPLVEFREPYISAGTVRRAPMLRVGDCPLNPARNRAGVLDLRILTEGAAVHCDPVMWAPADSPERVAQQLHAALFGVPQISVGLTRLPPAQRAVLDAWMGFWTRHRATLLDGTLTVTGVAAGYTTATAVREHRAVTAQYAPAISEPPAGARDWHIVSAHEDDVLVRGGGAGPVRYTVTDCAGSTRERGERALDGVTAFAVPPGGALRLTPAG